MKARGIDLIKDIFDEIVVLYGARGGEDNSIFAGIGSIKGMAITFISQIRVLEYDKCNRANYSMTLPDGYRKIIRLVRQGERFHRPILLIVDTIGADPGEESEKRGQAYRIAECMAELMNVRVPVISILCGAGGSGGAIALCVADVLLATEEGHLGVANPKACKEIIGERYEKYINRIYLNAQNLYDNKVVDKIITRNYAEEIYSKFCMLKKVPTWFLVARRQLKYRNWDKVIKKR